MLSAEEKREIDKEIAIVPYKKSACLGALKIIQQNRGGWLSDDSLKDVAEYLEMSEYEVDSIASFYNMLHRHPVGKHVILICDGVSCYIMGYMSIMEYLQKKLGISEGETTSDGLFTLLTMPCQGLCDEAPSMIIGTERHTFLTPEKVDKILDDLRKAN